MVINGMQIGEMLSAFKRIDPAMTKNVIMIAQILSAWLMVLTHKKMSKCVEENKLLSPF